MGTGRLALGAFIQNQIKKDKSVNKSVMSAILAFVFIAIAISGCAPAKFFSFSLQPCFEMPSKIKKSS
jgi:hypothetical protein